MKWIRWENDKKSGDFFLVFCFDFLITQMSDGQKMGQKKLFNRFLWLKCFDLA